MQESAKQAQIRGSGFAEALARHPELPAVLSGVDLRAELQPAHYTGQSVLLARQAVERAREASLRLCRPSET